MNNTTKPDQKTLAETASSKAENQVGNSTQTEQKKPVVEVKKPDATEKVTEATDNKPKVTVSEKTTVVKPETTESAQPKTKAEKAKLIYDEMIVDSKNDKAAIVAKIKKELGLTKAGAQTYFYKFQKESGRVAEKLPTKMDKAKVVFEKMTAEKYTRKEIIDAFIKEVGLTKAGASTYYQNLKNDAEKSVKSVYPS